MAKGVVGVVVKPAVGILDLAADTGSIIKQLELKFEIN